jgi:hypothetical protein
MTGWDPYQILWLPHEPDLTGWQVLRGYIRRMNWMYRTTPDREQWHAQAARIGAACWTLRTRARRRQLLADLAIRSNELRTYAHPEINAMADELLTPLLGTDLTLGEACDLRALEREEAALRLERTQAGQPRKLACRFGGGSALRLRP